MSSLNARIPVYVTRTNHNGVVGTFSLSPWVASCVLHVATLNIIGWGIYGLVELGSKVF